MGLCQGRWFRGRVFVVVLVGQRWLLIVMLHHRLQIWSPRGSGSPSWCRFAEMKESEVQEGLRSSKCELSATSATLADLVSEVVVSKIAPEQTNSASRYSNLINDYEAFRTLHWPTTISQGPILYSAICWTGVRQARIMARRRMGRCQSRQTQRHT